MTGIFNKNVFLRAGFFVFLFVVVGAFAGQINPQGPLGQILDRMDAHYKGLSSLRADVTMVKTDVLLNESDTNYGSTNYLPKTAKRPMYVRLDWTRPVEEQMLVIGDDYKLYRPKLGQAIIGKTGNASNRAGSAFAFISMSREQMKANYNVVYLGDESIKGGVKTFHLQLTPKTQTSYKMAEMWVDTDGMPRQAKITEQNNDTSIILLENIQKNVAINPVVFQLTWPKGTKELKG